MTAIRDSLADSLRRRSFIGGSDARIIMGSDEAALVQLWREKRGELEPADLSGHLIVQLGNATEDLNRRWYERNTAQTVTQVQRWVRHATLRWMAATLDGVVEGTGAVFEAKFMLPWSFSEEAAAEKHMAQLQHNMWIIAARKSVLSIITGGGKWVEIAIPADPLYQHLLLTAEKKFWRCVQTGEPPRLFGVEPPRPRIEAVRVVDMSTSNSWAEFAGLYCRTRSAFLDHETVGGVGLQIIRDWVLRFNGRGPKGLLDGKSPGQPSKLNDLQRQAIAQMIESGPIPAVHGVVRWRLVDLAQWIFEEFRITIAKQTLSRELRAMGYRKLSARPRHYAQAAGAIEDLKKLPRAPG